MRYPDIEGEAIARDEEIVRKAEMFDRFVKHIIKNEKLLSREEYEMLGLDDEQADILTARALRKLMEKNGHGR